MKEFKIKVGKLRIDRSTPKVFTEEEVKLTAKPMKAQELRIGNFITSKSYRLPYFEVSVEDLEQIASNPDHYFGIPLSEQWLIDMGAERVGEAKIFESFLIDLGRNRRLSVSVQPGNQYIWIQEYSKDDKTTVNDLVCLFNGDHDGELYLHTLQNLYHGIKGTELSIKKSTPTESYKTETPVIGSNGLTDPGPKEEK